MAWPRSCRSPAGWPTRPSAGPLVKKLSPSTVRRTATFGTGWSWSSVTVTVPYAGAPGFPVPCRPVMATSAPSGAASLKNVTSVVADASASSVSAGLFGSS